MKQTEMIHELLDVVRENSQLTAKMVETMATAQAQQAQVLTAWLEMFKPSGAAVPSTSVQDREQMREAHEAGEWDPIPANVLAELLSEGTLNG